MFFRLLAIIAMATGVLSAYPGLEADFEKAATFVKNLPKDKPSTATLEQQLHMYANFKIATKGAASGSPPLSPIDRMKFNAWLGLGEKDREQAMLDYIGFADEVVPGWRE